MERYFSFEQFLKVIPMLIKYLPVTLKETGTVILIATAAGVLIALVRVYKVPILSPFFDIAIVITAYFLTI